MKDFRMAKRIDEYQLIVFDLDGTLYYQRPLQAAMALKIGLYYLCRPHRLKEVLALLQYRKLREREPSNPDVWSQYERSGRRYGLNGAQMRCLAAHWMYRVPCRILKKFRDERLRGLAAALQEKGTVTAVYSDYPAARKLKALEMYFPYCFSSFDKEIRCQKPSPKGLLHIIKQLGTTPADTLMIGDRAEKDGGAALAAGTDYIILSGCPLKRKKQLLHALLSFGEHHHNAVASFHKFRHGFR